VTNAAPGGGTSGGLSFSINNPVPALTSLVPSSTFSGGPTFTLTINGSGFVSSSQVLWNGLARATTFVNGGQVTASIPATDIAVPTVANVTVTNPAPGGGPSNSLAFTVNGTTVSGHVSLQDWGGVVAGMIVTIEIRNVGSTTPLASQNLALDGAGNFTMNVNIAPGTYDVTAKASHWLRRKRGSQVISGGALTGQSFSLIDGDCDGDNEVAIGDYSILSGTFGKSLGDAGYDPAGDLNGDDTVDIGDFSILSLNFGLLGDD
jgi:hypothetical protein